MQRKMADFKNGPNSFLGSPDYPEDIEEDVENVEVDGDGCEDVLLRGDRVLVVAPHHHLGGKHCVPGQVHSNLLQIEIGCKNTQLDLSIVDEIDGEDEDANATVDQVEHLHVDPHEGEDGDHEAEEDEDEENTEEDPAAQSEVDLSLK